jgi:hypothetical protein
MVNPLEKPPCDATCFYHSDTAKKIEDILIILNGKPGEDGLLVKVARTMESFNTVRTIVYSAVGIILTTFMGGVIYLVLRSPMK